MAKLWHLIVGIACLAFLATIISIESASKQNKTISIETFIPTIIIVAIASVMVILWNIWKNPKGYGKRSIEDGVIRGGLSMAQAKFLAAMHLFTNHGIDIFAIGDTPETAKYIINLFANRCYPAAGEEAWYIRLKIRDKKYFEGLPTKIIIYMDGMGHVTDDPIMNNLTFVNSDLWRNPEIHFTKGVSKTSRSRSLKDIITRQVQETGEFPKDFQPTQIEATKEESN